METIKVLTPEMTLEEVPRGGPYPPYFSPRYSHVYLTPSSDDDGFFASYALAAQFFQISPSTLKVYLSGADGDFLKRKAVPPGQDDGEPVPYIYRQIAGVRPSRKMLALGGVPCKVLKSAR